MRMPGPALTMLIRFVVHAAIYFAGVIWMLSNARGYKGLEVIVYGVVFGFMAVIAWFIVTLTVPRQVADPAWRFALHVVCMVALFAVLGGVALYALEGGHDPLRNWRDINPFVVMIAIGALADGAIGYWLDQRRG
jgi:hypothetical protein